MKYTHLLQYAPAGDSNVSAGKTDGPTEPVVNKNPDDPGFMANAGSDSGDLDGGGGTGRGEGGDPDLNKGDAGPTPDKAA